MPTLKVIEKDGTQRIIQVENGWSLMELLRDQDFKEIEGACGGSLACATCHMYIHPDWNNKIKAQDNEKTDEEEDILDMAFDLQDCSRLGCQIRMSDDLDGMMVAMPGAKIDW